VFAVQGDDGEVEERVTRVGNLFTGIGLAEKTVFRTEEDAEIELGVLGEDLDGVLSSLVETRGVGEQAQAPSTEEVQVFIDAIQAGVQHA
jgi:hypothetical protein